MSHEDRRNLPKQLGPEGRESIEACHEVGAQGGPETLSGILEDPELEPLGREVISEIADQVGATHGGARDALLGRCATCLSKVVCPVEGLLKEREEGEQKRAKLAMLNEAHPLLTLARLDRAQITDEEFFALLESEDTMSDAQADGTLTPDALLAGINNWQIPGGLSRNQLPTLAYVPGVKGDGPFNADIINFGPFEEEPVYTGTTFILVDCIAALGFKEKESKLSKDAYQILASKLFNRMEKLDEHGLPQVLSPDNTQQSVIRNLPVGRVDEMRKAGKDRLYIVVCTEVEPDNPQIAVLGAHGGDADTQRRFIKALGI